MSSQPADTPSDDTARWAVQAGRLMRARPRQTWLVPLLAVPLSQAAISLCCRSDVLDVWLSDYDFSSLRRDATDVAAVASAVAASNGTRELTDEEAWLLLRFSHDYVGLGHVALLPVAFLLVGMEGPPDLPPGPRQRLVSEWIASGKLPMPMAALVAAGALLMADHPPMFLPKFDSRYAQVTRAIDRRLAEQGVAKWEGALALAHDFWAGDGWRDFAIWQLQTFFLIETKDIYKTEHDREQEEHEAQRRRHRAERKRLQAAATQAQEELRRLRPLRAKVDGLRAEVERLRNHEAELIQARDRAAARAKALEAANAQLERDYKETSHRLAALVPPPEARPEPEPPARVPASEEPELLADLLAGRVVFYFTGERRRSSAEANAESLRALGATDIRTFCLRQGSHGPEAYPPDALVVVDIRFVGHSQSGVIGDRAARSGARFLAVRSGKGSLARTVATALLAGKH